MSARRMEKNTCKAVFALTGVLVSAIACAAGYGPANNPDEEGTFTPLDEYVAHVEAMQEVELLPQVEGFIKEIKFWEGAAVKAGDVLYVLDDERYRAVVNLRKADLEAAEAEERRAVRYWERMQKADARGITQKERDDAEAGAEKAKAAVLRAKANLLVAEYDLKKTVVIAPISGQIGKTSAHVGDYVGPTKEPLAHIVQIDPIRVTFPLPDRAYIGWRAAQKKGKSSDYPMHLILPDGSEYGEWGTWDFADNEMNRETATIVMRLTFPNPDHLLIPNSYVKLLIGPMLSDPDMKRGMKRGVLKKNKLIIPRADPIPRPPPPEPLPDLKKGKDTATEDPPIKNIEKMLNQGYRIGAHNQLATSEAQRCASLIKAAIDREWKKESSFNWYKGLKTILVDFQLGAGGVVRSFAIISGSGNTEVDRTAMNALKRLKDKGGIPGLSKSFIEQYPRLTITMEPTQGR